MGVVVVPFQGGGPPTLIDVGGEPILNVSDLRGLADLPTGNLEPVTPQWSPDCRSLAYFRRDGGRPRVCRARADGTGAAPVPNTELHHRPVRWSAAGDALTARPRPGL